MSAPAAPAPDEEVKLLEVPDLRTWARERRHRLSLRAGMILVLPVLVTLYAKELGFYGPVATLGLPLEFLDRGPFAYEGKTIWFVILFLLVLCWLLGDKGPRLVLALCTGAILWAGFIYARLHWSKLFLDAFDPLQVDAPSALSWLYAFLLLGLGIAYVLAEGLLDTRDAQRTRSLDADAVEGLVRVGAQSTLLVLGAGLAGGAAMGLLFWLLAPALQRLPFHVNPVFALFAMGLLLAVAFGIAARRRAVDAEK